MENDDSISNVLGPEAELFCEAIAIESAEKREQWLREKTRGNQALYRRLCSLLASAVDRSSHSFYGVELPVGQSSIPLDFEFSEREIGPFQVRERIGEGGTSIVYSAYQAEPISRNVAIKVIKPGMESLEVLERFRLERVVLEALQHPNIARIIDAGMTPLGRRYLAMELIRGEAITEYCRTHRCAVSEILDLIIQIGDALQFAHQRGVLHRDLKPSNILVSDQSGIRTPTIVDFGIARLLGNNQAVSVETKLGQILGTLEYMSPEQASLGKDKTDTRTDIYALSAVLYELIFGSPPLAKSLNVSTTIQDALKIIAEESPSYPDKVQLAGQECRIDDDLKWILQKGLEKEVGRRYASAKDFTDDLRRYLRFEPISARSPSRVYRIRRFVRRHWLPVVSAAVLLIACIIGMTGLVVGSIQARLFAKQADEKRIHAERMTILATDETARANKSEAHAVAMSEQAVQEAHKANQEKNKAEKLLRFFVDRLAQTKPPVMDANPNRILDISNLLANMVESAQTLKESDPDAYYHILFETGAICHERTETKTSNRAFRDLLDFLTSMPTQDPVKINSVKVRLGASLGRSPSLIADSQELLLEVDESQLPPDELMRLVRSMAYNYMTMHQLDKAKEYYDRHPIGFDDYSDRYRAEFHEKVFELTGDPSELDKAMSLYTDLVERCRQTKPALSIISLCALGGLQVKLGMHEKGIANIKESIQLADVTFHGHDITLYSNRGLLVESLMDCGRFAEARETSMDLIQRVEQAPETALVKRFEPLLRLRACTCKLADSALTEDQANECIETLTKLESPDLLRILDHERLIDLSIAHRFLNHEESSQHALDLAKEMRIQVLSASPDIRKDLVLRKQRLLKVATELSMQDSPIGEALRTMD